MGKIGIKLGIDTGTIVPLLKRMEQSGLISKKRDLLDERRVLVELTPAGQALQASVWAVSDQIKSECQITDRQTWSCPRFTGHSGSCGLSCDELARRAHLQP